MIWHIFKKDWKLLWRLVVGVALVHFALAAALLEDGRFGGNRTLESTLNMLLLIGILGTGFLIAAVVHQDAIPGVRQDWLVRPVKRRDLLLAKILSVLLMVQAPILTADFMEAVANGFPLGESLATAVSRSGYIFLGFTLPLMALASLTKNFMETIVGGVAAFTGAWTLIMLTQRGRPIFVTLGTGEQWVPESAWLALTLVGVTAVLALQYFRRKTLPARWLMGTVALLCLCTAFIPWQAAFAVQQQLAPRPGSSAAVVIAFEPGQGKLRSAAGINGDVLNSRSRIREGDVLAYLPLRIVGLPDDTVLRTDHSEMRLIGPDGKVKSVEGVSTLEVRKEGHDQSEKQTRQGFLVPSELYALVNEQLVRLEIDYSLTLFSLAASHALPAMNGDQRIPDMGWCATKLNGARTQVTLRCLQAWKLPPCSTLFLEHAPSGRRNPPVSSCSPDYSPYLRRSLPYAMGHFGRNLPFRDPTGLAHYPVDGPQLAQSQVVLRSYQPLDHFTRRLVIPDTRLKDWNQDWGSE